MTALEYLATLKPGDPVIVTRTDLLNGSKTVKLRRVTTVAGVKIKVKGKFYDKSTGQLSRDNPQYDAAYQLSQPPTKSTALVNLSLNNYGLDAKYIVCTLQQLRDDVQRYRPEEMRRALLMVAAACQPEILCPTCVGHAPPLQGITSNWCPCCEELYPIR